MLEYKVRLWDGLNMKEIVIKGNAQNTEEVFKKVNELNLENGRYTLLEVKDLKTLRGGKRPGAGRKDEGKKTKVVRIPIEEDIAKLLSLKEDLKTLKEAWEKELHPTSPRDESARIIIEEIDKLLN